MQVVIHRLLFTLNQFLKLEPINTYQINRIALEMTMFLIENGRFVLVFCCDSSGKQSSLGRDNVGKLVQAYNTHLILQT